MNSSVYYYSTLAVCGLIGELSTIFFLQAAAWVVAMAVLLGHVVIENLCTYDR